MIDLNKTCIVHTIVKNKDYDKWYRLFELNKSHLNKLRYQDIYLLDHEPIILKDLPSYHSFQRLELFLYFDESILEKYDYFIYTELDCFLMMHKFKLQQYLMKTESDGNWMYLRENTSLQWIVVNIWTKEFLKKIIKYTRIEFEKIKEIGLDRYFKEIIGMKINDEGFFAYLFQKYDLYKELKPIDKLLGKYWIDKYHLFSGSEFLHSIDTCFILHLLQYENKFSEIEKILNQKKILYRKFNKL